MRVRHKPPTLVSMWMLDVFCCALGCVTLLFLLNSRMATDAVHANRTALLDLESADKRLAAAISALDATSLKLNAEEEERGKLAANVTELEGLRLQLLEESRQLAAQLKAARDEKVDAVRKLATARDDVKIAQAQLDATQLKLNAAEKKVDVTAKELDTSRKQVEDAADLLKKKQKDLDLLAKKEATSATALNDLQRLVRTKDEERMALEARMTATRKELTDLEARMRLTQKDLEAQLAAARAAAKAAGDELATSRAQIKDLNKKVDDANVTIIDLQGTNAKLADKFNKVQLETESRFAGIAMTGKKVAFLVDMSGSMGKRDLNSLDDTKWPLVVETVCKVMRSIPTLEQFQVVTFSSSANWVFGTGDWQTFTGEKSVEAVKSALLKVKPTDDTNMHAALEKAFTLRPTGLDTVYLFSDGLPTSGPNLTPAQQTLSEQERGVILAKQIRETLDRSWNRAEAGRPKVRINAVGFYFESVEVGAFLWALARDNDGSFVGMSKP